eukprot:1161668-Pelagomonas_calceolata.AAC.9
MHAACSFDVVWNVIVSLSLELWAQDLLFCFSFLPYNLAVGGASSFVKCGRPDQPLIRAVHVILDAFSSMVATQPPCVHHRWWMSHALLWKCGRA